MGYPVSGVQPVLSDCGGRIYGGLIFQSVDGGEADSSPRKQLCQETPKNASRAER
jgi:hypothetical protein